MKKSFSIPKVHVIEFESFDVLTASDSIDISAYRDEDYRKGRNRDGIWDE